MMIVGVLVSAVFLAGVSYGHDYGMGACPPSVPFKERLDVEKFLGEWFVIQKSSGTISCLKLNITKDGESLKISEFKRNGLMQKAVDHTFIELGILRFLDQTDPARMEVKFPFTPWWEPFTVVDTDYDTYAATWSCKSMAGMGSRRNGMILARKPFLDNKVADKLRKLFDSFGVSPHSMSFIDHKPCSGMLKSKSDHDGVISIGSLNINRKLDH